MSIDQTDKVDFISIDKTDNKVHLTISDHLDWSDEQNHLEVFIAKLNAYLDFIEEQQFPNEYRHALDNGIVISLVMKFHPTENFINHLKVIEQQIILCGCEFTWKVFQ